MRRLSLFSTLNIRSGEGWPVGWMLVFALLMGLPSLMTETAAYSLFLAEFDAQAIPYVYIGFALLTSASGFVYTFLEKRVQFSKFLTINLLVLGLSLCLFWFFLGIPQARWSRMALAIWYESAWALANLGFWGLAVRMFNIRQSKRLFGLIGTGLTLSESISGFLVPLLVRLVGTGNLLLIAAASYGGALVVQGYILRSSVAKSTTLLEESKEQEAKKKQSPLIDLFKNHYIVSIFAFAALYALVFYALDNAFFDRVETRFSDADQLASFLGVFFGLSGILTMVVGAFLSGRFLSRYGLRGGLLVMPVTLLFGTFLASIVGTFFKALVILFWLVVVTKLLNEVLAYTINRAAWQTLYEPLPQNQRLRGQTVVESMIKPLAGGLAGVLLLGLDAFFSLNAVEISYLLLIFLAAWLGVVMMLNRLYPTVLLAALTRRSLSDISFVPDKSSVAVLKQGLTSPHIGVVIYALNMLEEIEPESLPTLLPTLLDHPATEIRLNILHRLERFGITSAIPAIRHSLKNDPSASVRAVSVRTLVVLGDSQVSDELHIYLEDADPQLRLGAMIGLLRHEQNGSTGNPSVRARLTQLVKSPDASDRKFAAQVIDEVGAQEFSPLLLQLLDDENLEVQRTALLTAKKLHAPELWPVVVKCLARPRVRATAMATLAAGGIAVLPELRSVFSQYGQTREILIRLVQLHGRIRGPEAVAFLRDNLDFPDAQIRFFILMSLAQCGYQAKGDQRTLVRQNILAEAAHATWLLAVLADLGDDEDVALLHAALSNDLNKHLARIFLLLSFIYDSQAVLQVGNSLGLVNNDSGKQASDEKRAYALEIFELLVSAELTRPLLPLIDDLTLSERLQQLNPLFPQQRLNRKRRLQEILTGPNARLYPWTKACALYTVAQLSADDLSEEVTLTLSAAVPLHRETAVWTLFKLAPEQLQRYAEALGRDPNPQVKKAVRWLITDEWKGNRLMLSLIEKVIFLKGVSLFSETPEEVLVELAAVLEEMEIKPGETIIEKGEPGSSLYIIIDGQVQIHDGDQSRATMGAGEVFGELSILDPGPRAASVTTLEKSRLLRLDQEPFYELIDDHSVVSRRIMQILARQLRYAYDGTRYNRPAETLLNHVQQPSSHT
jgi:AAA family ATP:ADP antiporter